MKNPAAAALGALGGRARAEKLTPEQLSEIGRAGVQAKREKREQHRAIADVVSQMVDHINATGKTCVLFTTVRSAFFVDPHSDVARNWRANNPSAEIGTYAQGITDGDVIEDVMCGCKE